MMKDCVFNVQNYPKLVNSKFKSSGCTALKEKVCCNGRGEVSIL